MLLALPPTAGANPVLTNKKWSGGNFNYSVNTSSFFNNFPNGLQLTGDQVRYWVPYALSAWRERTGIQNGLTFSYASTTNNPCGSVPHAWNGVNEVAVWPGCNPNNPDCSSAGQTFAKFNAAGTLYTETDICIWGGDDPAIPGVQSINWTLRKNPTNGWDLIRTLRHEFGHALGLDHDTSSDTVMTPVTAGGGQGNRDLAGHDIRGMRMVYTPSSSAVARWRQITGSGSAWGAETSVPAVDGVWGMNAAVGLSSPNRVIVTELDDSGAGITFNRATYPISSGSSWNSVSVAYSGADVSWSPPAIAARPPGDLAGELWVAAAKIQSNTNAPCQPIRIYVSNDAFTTRSTTTINDCAFASAPNLTYDQGSGFYVLVTSNHTSGAIRFHTSIDGLSWVQTTFGASAPIALEGGDVACMGGGITSNCMLTYATGDTDMPSLRNRRFSVAWPSGTVTLSSTGSENTLTVDGIPAAGVRTVSGSPIWTLGLPTAAGSTTDRSNGNHMMITAQSSSNPITSFTWNSVGTLSTFDRHKPDLASEPLSDRIYLFYVQ